MSQNGLCMLHKMHFTILMYYMLYFFDFRNIFLINSAEICIFDGPLHEKYCKPIWFIVHFHMFTFCPKIHYLSQHFAISFAMLIYVAFKHIARFVTDY